MTMFVSGRQCEWAIASILHVYKFICSFQAKGTIVIVMVPDFNTCRETVPVAVVSSYTLSGLGPYTCILLLYYIIYILQQMGKHISHKVHDNQQKEVELCKKEI